ncbi:MAG: hypothetical protein WAQ41_00155 [bacterium]|jgi:hypothetical protein|nr:hypothetical protein [Bacillota bacterium]HHW55983.1 hypothetical protein [Bacillota bacterium]
MKGIPLEPRDISVLEALKPFLSPRGQELVAIMTTFVRVFGAEEGEGYDPEALVNLIRLLGQERIN